MADRLFLLPGMGATSAMYGETWRTLTAVEFMDWLPYAGERTLEDFARRIIVQHKLTGADTIGGSSFGGIVALEAARQLGASRVVLLGSAEQPEEISGVLRKLAPVSKITPWALLQVLAGSSENPLSGQFAKADPAFLRAACLAISLWNASVFSGEIVRIHGAEDLVIPCPAHAYTIAGAGHLVAWSHAHACVEVINEHLLNAPK